MPPSDEGWNDPPLPDEEPDPSIAWPTHGHATAAWAGWLALGYALVVGGRALLAGVVPLGVLPVAGVGVGLLVGVRLTGGDPRVWR
ncbi:hypothetical protein [Haloglomus halophilum]|uniref:hypothetical protein n=1 Tax=Haloglomus halophilum TaxID=2962672 RepID=UPI0020CA0C48|nr:hypothetical protein [Haloglomus halophilum]